MNRTERVTAIRDLARTRAALDLYDEIEGYTVADVADLNRLEAAAENVGHSFGLDTIDINSVDTCRQCVRPGSKVQAPGAAESYVRSMVRKEREALLDRKTQLALIDHLSEEELEELREVNRRIRRCEEVRAC